MQALSDKLAWYAALTGISMLMLIARLLQLMDFQVGNKGRLKGLPSLPGMQLDRHPRSLRQGSCTTAVPHCSTSAATAGRGDAIAGACWPDLLHFGLVFGLVFVGYAFLAHLIFGNAIAGALQQWSSVSCLMEGRRACKAPCRNLVRHQSDH